MQKLIVIERPIEEVFAYIADYRNSKGYLGQAFHFEAVTPPPYGVGTKAQALGSFMGIGIKLNYTVDRFEQNRVIHMVAPNQMLNGIAVDSKACWLFQERGPNRTVVSFQLDIQPRGLASNPFARMMVAPLISAAESSVSGMLDGAMRKLKHTLEHTSPAPKVAVA